MERLIPDVGIYQDRLIEVQEELARLRSALAVAIVERDILVEQRDMFANADEFLLGWSTQKGPGSIPIEIEDEIVAVLKNAGRGSRIISLITALKAERRECL